MTTSSILRVVQKDMAARHGKLQSMIRALSICSVACAMLSLRAPAQDQEDPLNKVHVAPPPASRTQPQARPRELRRLPSPAQPR